MKAQRLLLGWVAAGLVAWAAVAAENPPAPKQDAPPKLSVLRCGRLLDVRTGSLKEGALVVVRGDRIEGVLDRGAKIPEGAAVIDLSAYTVLPGLVDAHTHTFLQPGDYDVQLLKQSLPRRTLQAAAQARALLLAGFTTIRDLETEGAMYGDADLRDAIADGIVPGPRMQVATRAISTTGNYALLGYAHEVTVPKGVQIADGPWEIRKAVREQIQNGADWLKFYGDYRTFTPTGEILDLRVTMTQEEMDALVDEAGRRHRPVSAHCYSDDAARQEIITERDTPNGRLLHLARPITVRTEACLTCHSTAENAPPALTRTYGTVNGFGWHLNETIGAQILSVPMALPLKVARDAFVTSLIILVLIFTLVVVVVNLLMHFLVVTPIKRVSALADAVSLGQEDVEPYIKPGKDEVSSLSISFNRMRESLKHAMEMIK